MAEPQLCKARRAPWEEGVCDFRAIASDSSLLGIMAFLRERMDLKRLALVMS